MFEMSTEVISKELLKEMLAKAKGRRGYNERSTELKSFTIKKDVLPDLNGYVLAPKDFNPITRIQGIADCPLDLFLRLAETLKEHVVGCSVFYDIAQSKAEFDTEEETDLQLMIKHSRDYGWGVGLRVGTLSAGSKDMAVRAELFRRLIRCADLSESAHVRLEAGELSLESETLKNSEKLGGLASRRASDVGNCIYWSSGGRPHRDARGNISDINFSTLFLYFPEFSAFLTATKNCIEHFFSLGVVVRTMFFLGDYDGDYEKLRSFLRANIPCDDWRVGILGRPKYGIDDLDKMFEETDSLLLPLFVIKDRKVGEINVELYHSKGMPTLHFSTYAEDINKADKVIRQIVAELSDGKAVINEEV